MRRGPAVCALIAAVLLVPACRRGAGVEDDLGRRVEVPARVSRIVTIAPNVTELVAAAGASERIVGMDEFSNHPASLQRLPRVGGMEPSVELIAGLRPDLVIASSSGNQASIAPALSGAGIPLFVVKTDRIGDIPRSIRRLGAILGSPDASAAAASIEKAIESSRRTRRHQPRVLFLVWPDPLYVAGRGTFVDDVLKLCGAQNAVAEHVTGWPEYSMEMLLKNPPDVILFPSTSVRKESLEALFAQDALWRDVEVVRERRYFGVDEDVFTRPGPRVVDAARELNALLDRVPAR